MKHLHPILGIVHRTVIGGGKKLSAGKVAIKHISIMAISIMPFAMK